MESCGGGRRRRSCRVSGVGETAGGLIYGVASFLENTALATGPESFAETVRPAAAWTRPGRADARSRSSTWGTLSQRRPAPSQHPELLPVSISDGATCQRL